MSKAYKCERCGKLYEEPKPNLFEGVLNALAKPFRSMESEIANSLSKIYDICPECIESFRKWFAEGGETNHLNPELYEYKPEADERLREIAADRLDAIHKLQDKIADLEHERNALIDYIAENAKKEVARSEAHDSSSI